MPEPGAAVRLHGAEHPDARTPDERLKPGLRRSGALPATGRPLAAQADGHEPYRLRYQGLVPVVGVVQAEPQPELLLLWVATTTATTATTTAPPIKSRLG